MLKSRRMVLGAGVAAGAATLAALVVRKAALGSASDAVAVVSGGAPKGLAGFHNDPAEIAQWQAVIGRSVRVVGGDGVGYGVIEAVEPQVVRGRLPAEVRQNPFLVRFALDPAGAPAGGALYDIGVTIDGLSRLFLERGDDRGGKAILTALFA